MAGSGSEDDLPYTDSEEEREKQNECVFLLLDHHKRSSHSETGPFCKGSELRRKIYPLQIQCFLHFKGFRMAIFLEAKKS